MDRRFEIVVPVEHRRTRLEDFLFATFGGLSKMYLRELVRDERCEVNGRCENIGYRLRANDLIEIVLDPTRENAMQPQNLPLEIVFEDDLIIVANKPAGMLVHPTHRDKTGTLLNALAYHMNKGNPGIRVRPGLIHRLDRETSGLIVIAKTPAAHRRLSDHFRRRNVEKLYVAKVVGTVLSDEGIIELPIGRFADLKHWDVKQDGKPSKTRFHVVRRSAFDSLLELEPITGRTNQIRIHCAAIGHPIIGDVKRGGGENSRLCLHAARLAFHHPSTNRRIEFESQPDF